MAFSVHSRFSSRSYGWNQRRKCSNRASHIQSTPPAPEPGPIRAHITKVATWTTSAIAAIVTVATVSMPVANAYKTILDTEKDVAKLEDRSGQLKDEVTKLGVKMEHNVEKLDDKMDALSAEVKVHVEKLDDKVHALSTEVKVLSTEVKVLTTMMKEFIMSNKGSRK